MPYRFESEVARGEAKGELMEEWKDADGRFALFDPAKRRGGSVRAEDYTLVASSDMARTLVVDRGYSMRMTIRGLHSGSASIVRAERIRVIEISKKP